MARDVAGLDLSAFDESWLAGAELSLALPDGEKKGLSFFFSDEEEFGDFLAAAGLPGEVLEHERRLRGKFDLLPRYWLKLHYLNSKVSGFSQYFQVHPALGYPITTLRLFLRMYGHERVEGLEDMLEPGLASGSTIYGLVLKHEKGTITPRLSLRVERQFLPELFERFVKAGYLGTDRAEAYLDWDKRISVGDFTYVSFDPGVPGGCVLDFEKISTATLPTTLQGSDLPEDVPFNFVKCRLRADNTPEWAAYLMLSTVRARLEYYPDGSPKEVGRAYLDEVKRHYNTVSPLAVEHVGSTYQAGLIKADEEVSPTASNLYLATRAGLRPGDHLLDAGCGVCGPSIDIARATDGVTIEAVTLSEVQAETAKQLVAEAGLEERIRVHVGDYHALDFPDQSFDVVMFLESFGYAHDPEQLLTNAYRMLRPGGRLYIKDVFRRQGTLSAQELDELATFNRLYAFRTPTVEDTADLLAKVGFSGVQPCDLTDHISMERFNRAMFAKDSQPSLSAFGKRHFHTFTALPVRFWEVSARKQNTHI